MIIPDLSPQEIARFYSKLHLGGCGVRWAGPVNNGGYGRFEIYREGRRVRVLAHRLAYKLATGEDPGDAVIRHQCDTPPCCTPDCFLTGTQADNARDAVERGRANTSGLQVARDAQQERVRQRLISGRKRCSHCRETKDLADFSRDASGADGRAGWCKGCCVERDTARRQGRAS